MAWFDGVTLNALADGVEPDACMHTCARIYMNSMFCSLIAFFCLLAPLLAGYRYTVLNSTGILPE